MSLRSISISRDQKFNSNWLTLGGGGRNYFGIYNGRIQIPKWHHHNSRPEAPPTPRPSLCCQLFFPPVSRVLSPAELSHCQRREGQVTLYRASPAPPGGRECVFSIVPAKVHGKFSSVPLNHTTSLLWTECSRLPKFIC